MFLIAEDQQRSPPLDLSIFLMKTSFLILLLYLCRYFKEAACIRYLTFIKLFSKKVPPLMFNPLTPGVH